MLSAVTSYMYSKLGSNSSLLPLAIKDVANSVGITAGSYVTGKDVESKDRFIDEFGTQAIWLGGIPFYKRKNKPKSLLNYYWKRLKKKKKRVLKMLYQNLIWLKTFH